MADQGGSAEWITGWIEQQRELLRQAGAQAQADLSCEAQELGARWLEVGQAYVNGLMQFTGAPGAIPQFGLSEDFMQAWRAAATGFGPERDSMGRRFSEVLERLPPLGIAREHTEAWRELIAAEAECRRLSQELGNIFAKVQSDALTLLQKRARERAEAGKAVTNFRALYDLWVECGEQVYAQVAHSEAYCRLQAELGNASMRLRARQQALIEHGLKQLDLPTRSELNSVHRQLRELRQQLAALTPVASVTTARSKPARSSRSKRKIAPKKRKRS